MIITQFNNPQPYSLGPNLDKFFSGSWIQLAKITATSTKHPIILKATK